MVLMVEAVPPTSKAILVCMPVRSVKLIWVSVTRVFNNTLVVTEAAPTVPDTLVPTGICAGPVMGEPTVGADPM